MKHFLPLFTLLLLLVGSNGKATAQSVAIKTNLLYDATATINLGVELAVAPKFTVDLSGNYNNWEVVDNRIWKHYLIQPELRYWFCDRFAGHFLGFHLHGGEFDLANIDNDIKFLGTNFAALSDDRFKGWAIGAGIGYGYDVLLGRHWNLEFELGIGYAYMNYDRYEWKNSDAEIASDRSHNYVGLTKAAINIVYLF